MGERPKTVVLVGHGFEDVAATYAAWDEDTVQFIRAQPGQSLQAALKAVETPANIVLAAHGWDDGRYQWNEGESNSYADLFAALPRSGISSVSLMSCYGGTAWADRCLKEAPPGALVISHIGAENTSLDLDSIQYAEETEGVTDPVDLFLEASDNTSVPTFRAVNSVG